MKKAILFSALAAIAASTVYADSDTLEQKLEKAIEGKTGNDAIDAAMKIPVNKDANEAIICITKLTKDDSLMRRHTDTSKDGTPDSLNGKIPATDKDSLKVANSFFESSYNGTYTFSGKDYNAPLKNIEGGEEGSTTVCVARTLATPPVATGSSTAAASAGSTPGAASSTAAAAPSAPTTGSAPSVITTVSPSSR